MVPRPKNPIFMTWSRSFLSGSLRSRTSWRRQAERTLAGRQREPGIDDECLARDPARLVAREVDGAPGHIPAGPLGAEGTGAPPALAGVGTKVLHHRRPYGTRRDGVDANGLGTELDRDGADEPDDAGLRRGVRGASVAPQRRDGGNADDRATAAAQHRRHRRLRGEEHGLEVDGHHAVPLVFRRLEEILARLDADVVVEDVETPPALDRDLDHRPALGGTCHIGGECERLTPSAPDQPDGLLGALLHLIGAQDLRPLPGEEQGGRLAVPEAGAPRTGAGHDRDFAAQSSAHEPSTPSCWAATACHTIEPDEGRPRERGDPCTRCTRSSTESGTRRPASSSTARRRTSRSRSTTTSG